MMMDKKIIVIIMMIIIIREIILEKKMDTEDVNLMLGIKKRAESFSISCCKSCVWL